VQKSDIAASAGKGALGSYCGSEGDTVVSIGVDGSTSGFASPLCHVVDIPRRPDSELPVDALG
jgi:hypothetical protein